MFCLERQGHSALAVQSALATVRRQHTQCLLRGVFAWDLDYADFVQFGTVLTGWFALRDIFATRLEWSWGYCFAWIPRLLFGRDSF